MNTKIWRANWYGEQKGWLDIVPKGAWEERSTLPRPQYTKGDIVVFDSSACRKTGEVIRSCFWSWPDGGVCYFTSSLSGHSIITKEADITLLRYADPSNL
jgi:hypothetical protein